MANMTPSMRLKVKRDTFFLPEPNNGVFFRNNSSSFRMEGSSINQWIEKLLPMFNGENSLGDITKGLPGPYSDRVYEIAAVLYQNGYVRDASQDHQHQLTEPILKKYASQIEFLNSFGDSGAYRFQAYRQANVLAIGSGPFLVSLVSALIESGFPKLNVLFTDSNPTNKRRLIELIEHAKNSDPEVTLTEIQRKNQEASSWREIVQRFDSILYVSQEKDLEELRTIHALCLEEKKQFLPAISLKSVGLVGPFIHPESEGCWESAWRRLHHAALSEDKHLQARSSTAEAMMGNIIVFELFKYVTGVTPKSQHHPIYRIDLETLEGEWHSFLPHPLVTERLSIEWVEDFESRLDHGFLKENSNEFLLFFNQLTSKDTGIFHIWDEGDLKQLPLAQCCVQAVDPLSDGPAKLLPKQICSGLTHEEARRESALVGIEEYATEMVNFHFTSKFKNPSIDHKEEIQEIVGIGAGETFAEGVCRGLQRCLEMELMKQQLTIFVSPVQLSEVEDKRCQFYIKSLTTMNGTPRIGLGEEVEGFPVVWLKTNGVWYRSVGLNKTMALRNVLKQALLKAQNQNTDISLHEIEDSSVQLEERATISLEIPSSEETEYIKILKSAKKVLNRNRKQLSVFELQMEPFLKEGLAGVFGVLIREEESL